MTRQELYNEIKKGSKSEFILQEMVRMGFWEGETPTLPKELIEKEKDLKKNLDELSTKVETPQKALKSIHKERMAKALQKREETKQKKIKKAEEKEKRKRVKKENELGFIGFSFIKPLKITDNIDTQKLKDYNLPVINNPKELAELAGISLKELRFLTYFKNLSDKSHYVKFKITKKLGGFREISAPMPKLKSIQKWILDNILYKITPHKSAHGFVKERNIVSNASLHINKKVVISMDLKDFFPTITFTRVKGIFESFGYSTQISTIFSILLTEPITQKVIVNGRDFYLYLGERILPQGSPASPMISNLVCRRLDSRLFSISNKLNFNYSRYADDLSFSSDSYENISKMFFWVEKIVKDEGFVIHPKKSQIMRKGSSQRVTGIVVNEKLSIPKKDLKRFRAILYQIENSGLDGKFWRGKSQDLMRTLLGYANFINMVDSQKGEIYLIRVKELLKKYPIKDNSSKEIEPENLINNMLNIFKENS